MNLETKVRQGLAFLYDFITNQKSYTTINMALIRKKHEKRYFVKTGSAAILSILKIKYYNYVH